MRLFLLALSFLTRLIPGRAASDEDMAASCTYYPVAGLALGLIQTLPLWLGFGSNSVWLGAWLYVCLSVLLTRALHWDGLADVLDALGSGKKGEAFTEVLKDSRLGAFGAIGIAVFFSGQVIGTAACLEAGLFGPLVFAPLFGRSLPIFLAGVAPANPNASLGKIVARAPLRVASVVSVLALLCGGLLFMPLGAFLYCLVMGAATVFFLAAKAGSNCGYNGDFFGAAIICGETTALLSVFFL